MIPSNRWFSTSLQDRAAWYQNFSSVIATLGASLGLTVAEVAAIGHDAEWMEFLANSAVTVDGYAGAIRQYRKALTEGDIGSPASTFPADITLTPPTTAVPDGIFERLDAYVKRIRASPNYTDAIGTELGIMPSKGEDFVETEMKPVLKATSMPGSVVEVTFKRGKSDGVLIETKVDNATAWASAGNYFKSPASINIPDGTGLPHSVQVRARYIIGNEPVGLNSDTVNVVTTP